MASVGRQGHASGSLWSETFDHNAISVEIIIIIISLWCFCLGMHVPKAYDSQFVYLCVSVCL